ncbi:aromatic ring-hydroxylating dioxygenase subunit alpha [Bacillus sp. 03113]|uniref:aromatic ring-hydroxylating dioxygenase subunit alpha n=1 Tax=Bacillus sp. 03113 TaxID=2578211 RepID=UPI0015E89405|nr:aromatic ring-hydroxylating dioxygenase subunit alpha [Bacillus sp. 03113]
MIIQDPVLIHQWHPVLLSSDLNSQPMSVQVLGEPVVVFRTTYGIHAFKDLCIHRGVPLSLGKVVENELVCAYHGWTYDHCGKCSRIPSMPKEQTIPPKARAQAYACREAYGLVWVCMGEPIQEFPEIAPGKLKNPQYTKVYMGPYKVNAAGPRVIENFLDVSHLMYVHEGLLGDSQFPEINNYQVHESEGVLTSEKIEVYQPDPDGRGYGVVSHYVYEVYKPLCAGFTKKIDNSDDFFELFLIVLPETEHKSTAFMIMERNYAPDEPDKVFIDFQDKLLEQDRVIVENQKPELLPLDLQAELHLKCDRMSIAYRRMLKKIGVTFGTA